MAVLAFDVLVLLAGFRLLQGMMVQSPLVAMLIFVGVVVATLILSVAGMLALTRRTPGASAPRRGDR
jgi:hypothetical protein